MIRNTAQVPVRLRIPMSSTPPPQIVEIKLRQKSRLLELSYADGQRFELSHEFLRVYSPSAEVRGHGPGQEVLQLDKESVEIIRVEPVGAYAVQLHFSDGHSTGIYSWDYLYDIGRHRDRLWSEYRAKVAAHRP